MQDTKNQIKILSAIDLFQMIKKPAHPFIKKLTKSPYIVGIRHGVLYDCIRNHLQITHLLCKASNLQAVFSGGTVFRKMHT